MIISGLLSVVKMLVHLLFGWFTLPNLPDSLLSVIDKVFSYMKAGASILFLFVNQDVAFYTLSALILVMNFDKLYKIGMWILRKIPMLNIS